MEIKLIPLMVLLRNRDTGIAIMFRAGKLLDDGLVVLSREVNEVGYFPYTSSPFFALNLKITHTTNFKKIIE